jgi:hypothetical protein
MSLQQVSDSWTLEDEEDHGVIMLISTAEVEYHAASTAATEVLYLHNLLDRMGFAQRGPTPMYEDNTAFIEWGDNVIGGRERAKHIEIRKHFAHGVIQDGHMMLVSVLTTSQLPDILTKCCCTFCNGKRVLQASWARR